MAGIGAVFGILGSVVSAIGSIAAGAAQSRQAQANANALEYSAKIQDQKAMEERAVAQRKAFEHRREEKFAQSTLQARAAASGAGATDPTIIKLGSDIAGRAEYYALSQMASGESAAIARENQAKLDRYSASNQRQQAKSAMMGGFLGAASGVLSGASSAFGKFGGGSFSVGGLPSADDLNRPNTYGYG
jgi:hypothetical protein